MPRSGITVYLPPELEERIAGLAKERHCSESSLIANAVKARFDKRTLEIVKTLPRWREQSLNLGFPPEAREEFLAAMDAFDARVGAASFPIETPPP